LRILFTVLLLAALCAGCGTQVTKGPTATSTFRIPTATLSPSPTPHPSETPLLPPSPTVTPVEGITSTQLNVRGEPSTAGTVIGIIPANTKVQIIGKDPGENWWQILYPQGNGGKGWVTAQYVTTAGKPEAPVVGGGNSNTEGANVAVIQQQLNVRSGPGTSFNSLGTLNPQDVVTLIGKDANGAWLQIKFIAGPEGKGWINAAFAQAQGVDQLPIVGDTGQIIGTGTPMDTPLPPTPTIVPAPSDNDSAESSAINVVFTATGTRALQFSSDVSSPTGDSEDWIQFTPFTQLILLELTCRGNGQLTLDLQQNRRPIPDWGALTCGKSLSLETNPGTVYLFHVQAAQNEGLSYTQYTFKVTSLP